MTPNVWWVIGGAAAVGGVYLVYRSQAGKVQQPQQQSPGAASPLMMYAVPPSPTGTVAPDTGGILSVGSSIGATTGGPGADMAGGGVVDSGNGGMDSYYASQTSMAHMQYDLASQQSQYDYQLGSQSIEAQKQMTNAGLVWGFLDQLYPAGYSGSTQFAAGKTPGGGQGFNINVTSFASEGTSGAADYFARAGANTPAQVYVAKHSQSQSQPTNVQASRSPEQAWAGGSQNKAAGLVTGGKVSTAQSVRAAVSGARGDDLAQWRESTLPQWREAAGMSGRIAK